MKQLLGVPPPTLQLHRTAASPFQSTDDRYTPLLLATFAGSSATVAVLLAAGARLNDIEVVYGLAYSSAAWLAVAECDSRMF